MKASAPAKVILSGEHSVVYGKPAIALAVSPRIYVSLSEGEPFLSFPSLNVSGPLSSEGSLFSFFRRGFEVANIPQCRVDVSSDFPVGAGLGSSAAMACSFLKAALPNLESSEIGSLANEMERTVHGNPSGVDSAVCSSGGLIEFVRGAISPLEFHEFPLIIGYTGVRGDTLEAVSGVKRLLEQDPLMIKKINEMGELTLSVKKALLSGDLSLLGSLMTENHALLKQIGVSSSELDALVDAAISAGALRAKLTGGGKGGCMIALSDSEEVFDAISSSGGKPMKAFISKQGVRLED